MVRRTTTTPLTKARPPPPPPPHEFLEGFICQLNDPEDEEPENREKEFLRIAVSIVATLANDIQEVEKLLAQPLEDDED